MPTESFKFWDSFDEALDPLDDATYGRVVRAVAHKVFRDEEPDFGDSPILGAVYTVMMRNSEQSRDIARRARENGSKSAGRPRKNSSKKTSQKPRKPTGLTNRREVSGGEAIASPLHSSAGARGSGADAPAPAPSPYPTSGHDAYDDDQYPTAPPPPEP